VVRFFAPSQREPSSTRSTVEFVLFVQLSHMTLNMDGAIEQTATRGPLAHAREHVTD
jgi:hypothetical protein